MTEKICFLFVLIFGVVLADVPHLISYQGRLTDDSGTPLTGTHDITFRLYETPSGGTALWSETHTVELNSEGLYNVMLGSVLPFPDSVDFSEPYWLAVCVDGGAELCRYQLGAAPYALNIADTVRKVPPQVFEGFLGDGIVVRNTGGTSYYSSQPGDCGFETYSPTAAGVRVVYPQSIGVEVRGSANSDMGIYIFDAMGTGDPDTGIVIRNVGYDAIFIDSPGDEGIDIRSPAGDGILVWQPNTNGLEIGTDSMTESGIYIHTVPGSEEDSSIGIKIENLPYGWSAVYMRDIGGDGIWMSDIGKYGIWMNNIGQYGIHIGHSSYTGVHIYEPGTDGVGVYNPGSDCYYCNSLRRLFRVTKNCEVFSHSYNQYIPDGDSVMVAQISATVGRYIEFIGEDSVAGGICRVDFPEKFRKVISIGEDNPVEIFITPYGPLGEYWVERGDSYFVLHCAPDVSGKFGYRICAKVKGFEGDSLYRVSQPLPEK